MSMSWEAVEDSAAPWNARAFGRFSEVAMSEAYDDWLGMMAGAMPYDATCRGQSAKYAMGVAYSVAPRSAA